MPPPKITTAELLAAVTAGDREALRSLYRTHSARLFGIAMAVLRDRPAASDALQEAFVRIWQKARRFEPASADAEAWLAGLVRHAALDIARGRGREAINDAGRNPAVDPDALDALAATEPGMRLRDSLRLLEPKPRAAVVLGFVHGLSYGELTTHLNEPAGAARTMVRRGLATIREALP
jgi:RNA polymerase sigma-70 factor (ECF subfamily)